MNPNQIIHIRYMNNRTITELCRLTRYQVTLNLKKLQQKKEEIALSINLKKIMSLAYKYQNFYKISEKRSEEIYNLYSVLSSTQHETFICGIKYLCII